MQISAVNPNFQGRRDRVDELINLDDQSVQRLAYLKTDRRVNYKKHRNITNTLIAAAPVAAGLGAAVFSKGKTKIFSKEVSGLAARFANGLKDGGLLGAQIGAVGLVGLTGAELFKNSENVRKFDREHPIMSLITLLAAGVGAMALTGKAAGKLASVEAPKFLQKMTDKTAKFLNTNKNIASVKRSVNKFAAKVPDALKEIGALALYFAPGFLLLGGLIHSLSFRTAVNRDFNRNYSELKEKQLNLSRARQRELQIENDFLKTDAQNREDLALVKDPLKDLPDDVIEKVEEIRDNVEQA